MDQPGTQHDGSVLIAAGGLDRWLPAALVVLYLATAGPALWLFAPPRSTLIASLLLGSALVCLSVIDIRTFRLPDLLTLPLLAAGIGCCFLLGWEDVRFRIAAAAGAYATLAGIAWAYRRWRGQEGLGLGDAKLLAASGAWLGLDGLPVALLVASLAALSAALVARMAGSAIRPDTRLPFGPFLSVGTWLVWLYGAWL